MKLPRWLGKIIYGGTSTLHLGEQSLIALVSAALDQEDRKTLEDQIRSIWLVQRPQPRRMTIITYHDPEKVPSFADDSYEQCLAELRIKTGTGKPRTARLMLHRGRLHSFEGSIPESITPSCHCELTLWPHRKSTTAKAIDKREHGNQSAPPDPTGKPEA
ncbi:MAG: hypothetical protein EOP88_22015 [Verrucomicrobiaceae bacterium]|nr:MAG: hypothetical protein EOP88_22015 [Verrucomicrobiaceae bacterium]